MASSLQLVTVTLMATLAFSDASVSYDHHNTSVQASVDEISWLQTRKGAKAQSTCDWHREWEGVTCQTKIFLETYRKATVRTLQKAKERCMNDIVTWRTERCEPIMIHDGSRPYDCNCVAWGKDCQPMYKAGFEVFKCGVAPTPAPAAILSNKNAGCYVFHDEKGCTGAKDGRRGAFFSDSPCEWCCGKACHSRNRNKCEPGAWLLDQHDYIGESKNGNGDDSCPDDSTAPTPAPTSAGTLSNNNAGCYVFNDEKGCTGAKDGRRGAFFSDSPCEWCCGKACHSRNYNKCEPRAWLLDQYDYIGTSKNGNGDDSCPAGNNLDNNNPGCYVFKHEKGCTGAKDGRRGAFFSDSPCEWCCGKACHSRNSHKCEPRAWLLDQHDYIGTSKNGVGDDSCK